MFFSDGMELRGRGSKGVLLLCSFFAPLLSTSHHDSTTSVNLTTRRFKKGVSCKCQRKSIFEACVWLTVYLHVSYTEVSHQ